jgi:hypothetical protein
MTVSFFQANLIFEGTARIKKVQGAPLREGSVFYHRIILFPKNYIIPKNFPTTSSPV